MAILRTIGFIVLFYFVMRVLRSLFEPKNTKSHNAPKAPQKKRKEKIGEFIDYEEVN